MFEGGLGFRHLVDTCTSLIVAHRQARTSSHSAERLNLCLSGKVAHVGIHVSPVRVSRHLCMVAEPSCVLRRCFVALESCHDDHVGRTIGAVGTVTAAGWECFASSELQDCESGISGRCDNTYCDNSVCFDGRRAGAPETLLPCWRRHGRAGASSCYPSQRQSRPNCVL